MEPPAGDAPAGILYKRNPQAAAWRRGGRHAYASQSPVPPRTRRAYETHLSTGSTAMFENGALTRSCTGLHSLTERWHRYQCFEGDELVRASGNAPELGTHLVRCEV